MTVPEATKQSPDPEPDIFVIVATGWRGATKERHETAICDGLLDVVGDFGLLFAPKVILRHGKCKYGGVDLIVDRLARGYGWEVEEFPAEERDGRILGSPRNRSMFAAEPAADLCVAFPGPNSTGTWDCQRWAARYGVPYRGYPLHLSPWKGGGRRDGT